MPFTGSACPSPERYGAGEGNSNKPLLQIVYESVAAARGTAYDAAWPPASVVGVENMAYARAITYDAYGANRRLANQFIPSKATAATGMLPRWERIFGLTPAPTDTEVVRRNRLAAAWALVASGNSLQPVIDALTTAIGPVFVAVIHETAATETEYIGGVSGVTATGTTPPLVTLSGTPLLQDYYEIDITTGGPLGTALFTWKRHGATMAVTQTTAASYVLGTTGITASFSAGTYATNNVYKFTTSPQQPWLSTIAHLSVQLTQTPTGYHNADGSPNQAFYAAAANVSTILDKMLPAWATYDWFINSSHSAMEFRLDERDLSLEAFGS